MVNWKKTITGAGTTTVDEFAGDVLNSVVQYHNDVDLAAGDPQGIARIATETIFDNEKLKVGDPGGNNTVAFSLPEYSEDKTLAFPSTMSTTDEVLLKNATQIVNNKDINGASNTISLNATTNTITDTSTALGDIFASNGTKFVRKARGSANQVLTVNPAGTDIIWAASQGGGGDVFLNQTNTYGDFSSIFRATRLKIRNPANTFGYTIVGAGVTADRNATLPVLTADDTFAMEAFAQPLSNKTITASTINATTNTITDTSTAAGDLMVSNGTKFVRRARGTALQVLRTNSAGTDIEYASLELERVGKSTATGNGSSTIFTITHGLGTTPGYTFISVGSSGSNVIAAKADSNATTITVTFASPPSNGGSVVIYWRVVA